MFGFPLIPEPCTPNNHLQLLKPRLLALGANKLLISSWFSCGFLPHPLLASSIE